MFEYVKAFFQKVFWNPKGLLVEVLLRLLFILEKGLLKKNLTIILTSITKSNFTLSYPNKNHSPKLTFNIFKPNKNYYFKSNFSKRPFLKDLILKDLLPKVKPNTPDSNTHVYCTIKKYKNFKRLCYSFCPALINKKLTKY